MGNKLSSQDRPEDITKSILEEQIKDVEEVKETYFQKIEEEQSEQKEESKAEEQAQIDVGDTVVVNTGGMKGVEGVVIKIDNSTGIATIRTPNDERVFIPLGQLDLMAVKSEEKESKSNFKRLREQGKEKLQQSYNKAEQEWKEAEQEWNKAEEKKV